MLKKIDIKLPEGLLNVSFNESLIHQVVVAYMAASRSGNVKQKTRSEVRGGGKKPWKQKGTGRARAGSIRSPIWRGGGVTFAAKPRDYSQKVNRKMYKGAFVSVISELFRKGLVSVVDEISMENVSTKVMKKALDGLGFFGRILIVADDWEKSNETMKALMSAKNLKNVYLYDVAGLDPYSLVSVDNVLISKDAFVMLMDRCEYV